MRPSLGVLITYHNEGALLTECLASLAAQPMVDEILVFDDASTEPPEAYIPAGRSVQVIRNDANVGPSIGRNRLVAASKAEYIHFHDADDLFQPGWVEQVQAVCATGTDCVFTEVETIHDAGGRHPAVLDLKELEAGGDLLSFALRRSMLTPSGTYRRALVQKMGGYNEQLWQSEDYEFHVRLALMHPKWRVLTASLVSARVRAASRSKRELEVWESAWQAVRGLEHQVPRSHQPDLAAFSERVGRQLWQLGARNDAVLAFEFAEAHGLRNHDLQPGHRWLARVFGLVRAHRIAGFYRAFLPSRMRRMLAARRN